MLEPRFSHLALPLLRAGVAPRFVNRTIFELDRHFQDLVAQLRSQGLSLEQGEAEASVRLGSDETILASVLARPELRSWARQWPWMAFAILPVSAFVIGQVLVLFVVVWPVKFAAQLSGNAAGTLAVLQSLGTAFVDSALWAVPAAAAAMCAVQAFKRRTPMLWPVIGVVVIGLLGALTNASFILPPGGGQASLGAGIGFSTEALGAPLLRVAFTVAAVGVAILWWHQRRERPDLAL